MVNENRYGEKRNMREEIDSAMKNLKWDEERSQRVFVAIGETDQVIKKTRISMRIAIVLAVCIAMTASVFALNPSLFEKVQSWVGGFRSYVSQAEPIWAESEGIRIESVAAMSDSLKTKIYLFIQDLQGDRLDKNLKMETTVKTGADSLVYGSRCISYDKETKTALMEVNINGGFGKDNQTVKLVIEELQPGFHKLSARLPVESLKKELLACQKEGGMSVLVPEQTPYKFPENQDIRLSSFGFGEDGWFHLQVKLGERVKVGDFLTTVNSKTGKTREYNQELNDTIFENGDYAEFLAKGANLENFSDIDEMEVYGTYAVKDKIEGKWEMEIPVTFVEERKIQTNRKIGKLVITEINLSPLGIGIKNESTTPKLIYNKEITLFFKDGSSTILKNKQSGQWTLEKGGYDRWDFDEPINPQKVLSVQIGKEIIEF